MNEEDLVKRQRRMAHAGSTLAILSVDEDYQAWRERVGDSARQEAEDAVSAMLTLCEVETSGPWSTREGRTRIRSQLERMKQALEVEGITDEVRRLARQVIGQMIPQAAQMLRDRSQ